MLLRAWDKLRLPGAELVLVGPLGREGRRVLRGHAGRFIHHSRIANDALRSLLVRASVFVLPSVEDGCPQAPVEAMACGVPIIVTENVGTADIVTDGHDGFVVPAFDVDALAARLETLYRHHDRRLAMGEQAAATATRRGSWSDYAAEVVAVHRAMHRNPQHREAA